MSAVVIERTLDYFGPEGVSAAVVRVLAPFEEGANWRCQYQLSWPGYEREFGMLGVDAWQALELAMKIVPAAIFGTDDFKAGRIGFRSRRLKTLGAICREFGVKPVRGPRK